MSFRDSRDRHLIKPTPERWRDFVVVAPVQLAEWRNGMTRTAPDLGRDAVKLARDRILNAQVG
jgi:hypothetical protein